MAKHRLPNETVELIDHEVAFQGYFKVGRYSFRHGLHQGGKSQIISREVFERGQAGGVLPYDPVRDELVLITQFRAGAYVAGHHPWTWEIIAGIIEDNKSAADMVRREAVEEAGLTIGDMEPIQRCMLTPGACSEACQIFVGRVDTTNAGGVFGLESEGENIRVDVISFADARAMLEDGQIDNAVTVIALQWLVIHRDDLRKRWR